MFSIELPDWLDALSPSECYGVACPFLYIVAILVVWIMRKMGFIPIHVTFHNTNTLIQSCILLICLYFQYNYVSTGNNISFIDGPTDVTNPIIFLFMISKIFEWINTILLIVSRRQTIPLNLWHHATIGVACYTGYYSNVLFFIGGLNSLIHIITYAYHSNKKCSRSIACHLTLLQIVQLFGGIIANYYSFMNTDSDLYQKYIIVNGLLCINYSTMFLQSYATKYSSCQTDKFD